MIRVVGKRDRDNVSIFFFEYNITRFVLFVILQNVVYLAKKTVEENLCKKRMGGVCCRFARNLFPYDLVTWMLDLDVFMNVRFVILIIIVFSSIRKKFFFFRFIKSFCKRTNATFFFVVLMSISIRKSTDWSESDFC